MTISRLAASLTLAAAVLSGCSSGSTQGGPAPATKAGMIDGLWAYRSPVPTARMTLEIELWQVSSSDSVSGRIVHWMAGDMGTRTTGAKPLSGMMNGTNVWFIIPLPPPAAAVRIEGVVDGDTLVVTNATTGGDDNGLAGGKFVRTGPVKR